VARSEWVPYLYPDLEIISGADEQAAIDDE
jgi:hypothetical protein